MTVKKTTTLGHFIYSSIIIASLVYWKTQTQLQDDWIQYTDASNHSVTLFLKNSSFEPARLIEKQQRDSPYSFWDSLQSKASQLEKQTESIIITADNLGRLTENVKSDTAITANVNILSQQWQEFNTSIANTVTKDTLWANELSALLAPAGFEHWKSSFYRGNVAEKKYLLSTLKRLIYTMQLIALQQLAQSTHAIDMVFDGVRMQMYPQHRPIAGQPFRAEFYPVWYATHIDSSYVTLDGRKYYFVNGVALCDTVFHSPGTKTITPCVNIVYPGTGVTESVKKDFSIEVVR